MFGGHIELLSLNRYFIGIPRPHEHNIRHQHHYYITPITPEKLTKYILPHRWPS
jgi:hypothetical protein